PPAAPGRRTGVRSPPSPAPASLADSAAGLRHAPCSAALREPRASRPAEDFDEESHRLLADPRPRARGLRRRRYDAIHADSPGAEHRRQLQRLLAPAVPPAPPPGHRRPLTPPVRSPRP